MEWGAGKFSHISLTWYGEPPRGLVVVGLDKHEEPISVYLTRDHPGPYGDAVLDELDPVPMESGRGWCHGCRSSGCSGVRWALARLYFKTLNKR